jgi:hypothetical protein
LFLCGFLSYTEKLLLFTGKGMNISGNCISCCEEDAGEQNYQDVDVCAKKKPLKFHNLNGLTIKVSYIMTLLQK